jgi:uncharacterized membrane protein YjdF
MNKIKTVKDCIPLFIFLLTAKINLISGFIIYGYEFLKEIVSIDYIVSIFITAVIFFTLCQFNLCYIAYSASFIYMIVSLLGIGFTYQHLETMPMSKFNIFTFFRTI